MKDSMKGAGTVKSRLHPNNKHRLGYDFEALIESYLVLSKYITPNRKGEDSIDFHDPKAVKALNKALLIHHYNIDYWDIPGGYLCPPIPGRADYIHHMNELLMKEDPDNKDKIIKCLDIGVGANCVYPIIGVREYNWEFIGSEIDDKAIANANEIITKNKGLEDKIEIRKQKEPKDIFYGVLKEGEKIDLCICNPPFYASMQEAKEATKRKVTNLIGKKVNNPLKNFGGKSNELWTDGGEVKFITEMIRESKNFADSCTWFSTLVSKQSSLKNGVKALGKVGTVKTRTIPMGQGNKSSRILAWTYESKKHWQIFKRVGTKE